MESKDMKQFREAVLNLSNPRGVRGALRDRVPLIDRLENTYELRGMTLTELNLGSDGLCMVAYETISPSGLYPNSRARLIAKGIIKANNVLRTWVENRGESNESENLVFGFSGNSVQVSLRAYNPNYREK